MKDSPYREKINGLLASALGYPRAWIIHRLSELMQQGGTVFEYYKDKKNDIFGSPGVYCLDVRGIEFATDGYDLLNSYRYLTTLVREGLLFEFTSKFIDLSSKGIASHQKRRRVGINLEEIVSKIHDYLALNEFPMSEIKKWLIADDPCRQIITTVIALYSRVDVAARKKKAEIEKINKSIKAPRRAEKGFACFKKQMKRLEVTCREFGQTTLRRGALKGFKVRRYQLEEVGSRVIVDVDYLVKFVEDHDNLPGPRIRDDVRRVPFRNERLILERIYGKESSSVEKTEDAFLWNDYRDSLKNNEERIWFKRLKRWYDELHEDDKPSVNSFLMAHSRCEIDILIHDLSKFCKKARIKFMLF